MKVTPAKYHDLVLRTLRPVNYGDIMGGVPVSKTIHYIASLLNTDVFTQIGTDYYWTSEVDAMVKEAQSVSKVINNIKEKENGTRQKS